jgi:hypothetical protein
MHCAYYPPAGAALAAKEVKPPRPLLQVLYSKAAHPLTGKIDLDSGLKIAFNGELGGRLFGALFFETFVE